MPAGYPAAADNTSADSGIVASQGVAEGPPSGSKGGLVAAEKEGESLVEAAMENKLPELSGMVPLFDFDDDRKCLSLITCETIFKLAFNNYYVTCTTLLKEFKILMKFLGLWQNINTFMTFGTKLVFKSIFRNHGFTGK